MGEGGESYGQGRTGLSTTRETKIEFTLVPLCNGSRRLIRTTNVVASGTEASAAEVAEMLMDIAHRLATSGTEQDSRLIAPGGALGGFGAPNHHLAPTL
jgi:hypothetical protein